MKVEKHGDVLILKEENLESQNIVQKKSIELDKVLMLLVAFVAFLVGIMAQDFIVFPQIEN